MRNVYFNEIKSEEIIVGQFSHVLLTKESSDFSWRLRSRDNLEIVGREAHLICKIQKDKY